MLARLLGYVIWVLNYVGALATMPFDSVLRAKDDSTDLNSKRFLIWILGNAVALILLIVVPFAQWGIWIVGGLTLAHLMIMAGALLVFYEEDSVWNGLTAREDAHFPDNSVLKNVVVLFSSTVFFLAFFSLAMEIRQSTAGTVFLDDLPPNEPQFREYGEFAKAVVSGLALIGPALQNGGWLAVAPWSDGAGWYASHFLYYASHFWLFTFVLRIFMQYRAMHSLMNAIIEAKDDRVVRFLQMRAVFAPAYIKKLILGLALNHPNDIAKRRAIAIVPHAKIFSFPQTFTYHIEQFNEELQGWGLSRIERFLDADGALFDGHLLANTMRNLGNCVGVEDNHLTSAIAKRSKVIILQLIDILEGRGLVREVWALLPRDFLVKTSIYEGDDAARLKVLRFIEKYDALYFCKRTLFVLDGRDADTRMVEALGSCRTFVEKEAREWKVRDQRKVHRLLEVKARNAIPQIKGELARIRKAMPTKV